MTTMQENDLKSNWKNAGGSFRNETDLQKMTRVANHPALKKIKMKLIVESIGLMFFLFIYYDWFDGNKKPFILNLLLVGSLILYILNDVIGYITVSSPIRGMNLRLSIQNYLKGIRRLSVLSLIISFLFSISIIVFFSSAIDFTKEKKLILAGIIVVLIQMLLISFKTWKKRINNLKQQLTEFNDEEMKQV
jgi:heme A synthase